MFNLSWLIIVATASTLIAPAVVVLHLVMHYVFVGLKKSELSLISVITGVGILLDIVLFRAGVFVIDGQITAPPVWLNCLWPVLATTLMHAFETLQRHLALAAVVGAVGGTLSYMAGTRLTDVAFADALLGPALVAVMWFVLMPALLFFAQWLGRSPEARFV